MKAMLLQQLLELIESDNPTAKRKLKVKLCSYISKCRLDMDEEKEVHTKKLIISTIQIMPPTLHRH